MGKRTEATLEFQGPYPMDSLDGQPFDGFLVTLVPEGVFPVPYATARYARIAGDKHAIRTDNGKDFTGESFDAVKDQLITWLRFFFGVDVARVVTVAPDPAIERLQPYPLEG